ncbi:MAG: polysaccharide biosynthesis protein [Gammaproteobacteria bacterium]|nr:polysaccharide biosynthesis protein [Gammaproteobacteria bacterium]
MGEPSGGGDAVTLPAWLHRLRHRATAFVHDLVMVPLAWLGAFWLRFNLGEIPSEYLSQALRLLPVVVVVQGGVFWWMGLYRGVWRFASLPDLLRILKATALGTLLVLTAVLLLTRMEHVPRSVFVVYAILLPLLLGGPRLAYRWSKDHRLYAGSGKRALIVGAGRAGDLLVRDLLRDARWGYEPVGFVDDEARRLGREVHGVRVLGTTVELPGLVQQYGIETILIAIPSAGRRAMQRIVSACEATGVPFRTLPGLLDEPSGRLSAGDLREVSIEDLLGREPVTLDWRSITQGLSGKSVLITGGGGSIGSELCRQIARLGPQTLVVFENSEFNLFRVERELRRDFPNLTLRARLGDVCDEPAVRFAFSEYQPDVVFHAAAYKHVPLLQDQAREAVHNNVLGTRNVAATAAGFGCEAFVLISTDKAVNPTNVMGATKRVAEIVCQGLQRHASTRFITVRFGNVLDSAGSVVPTFREQIAAGGPVTVTHPDITRYFMTIPEACQLILQAAVAGRGGEIFVLDMGEPVRIRDLAEQMIRLSGKRPGVEVPIVFTGLRPGEKLYEELFHEEERLVSTGHEKLRLAHVREVDPETLDRTLEEMGAACVAYDEARLTELLKVLVPELGDARRRGVEPAARNVLTFERAKR